ncbi:tRNA (adenine(22)-N(1))-methyltransferase TrmK [Pseudomonas putida]|nr:tRNA (adenine(22)-N(1))-methyltransferase TrmK [Pseudomonas putida]
MVVSPCNGRKPASLRERLGRVEPWPWSRAFEKRGVGVQNRRPIRPRAPGKGCKKGQGLNEQTLSMRLERVAAHVPAGARLADIGSDHGYLPVALMLRGCIEAAVAGEAAPTPYRSAQRKVRKNDLEARIAVRLADGLDAIEPQDGITTISLCGMGGEKIREILERGKHRLSGKERLVLQPNVREGTLREWLMENDYRILCEELLEENAFTYEIIVAERCQAVAYSPQQLYFGPLLMEERSPAFLAKWHLNLKRKRRVMAHFVRARQGVPEQKVQEVATQVQWIEQLLA